MDSCDDTDISCIEENAVSVEHCSLRRRCSLGSWCTTHKEIALITYLLRSPSYRLIILQYLENPQFNKLL